MIDLRRPLRPLALLALAAVPFVGHLLSTSQAEKTPETTASAETVLSSQLQKLGVKNPVDQAQAKPMDLRGFGQVSAAGASWKDGDALQSLVIFQTDSEDHGGILASKYLSDLLSYSTATQKDPSAATGGAQLTISQAGQWLIGQNGKQVFVLTAPNDKSLATSAKALGANSWTTPAPAKYPKYLDCFDISGLGMWWMPPTKTAEILEFAKENPAIVNVHSHHGLSSAYAPNVYDFTGADNIIAQARLVGKPYRFMIWGGIPVWWARSVGDMSSYVESALESAHPARDLPGADGYYNTQIASPLARGLELDAMVQLMNRYKDNDDLVAWMEPHGEFFLSEPRRVPPNAEKRFAEYLQKVRGYSLEKANEAFGTQAKSWDTFPYPEMAYFFGRRGAVVDLDDNPWKWWPGISKEEGLQKGIINADFDDSTWAEDVRTSRRLLNQFRAEGETTPLWYRFTADVPADFLKGDEKIYLHVLPYTQKDGKDLDVWVNGQLAPGKTMNAENYLNPHTQFDVTGLLKAGANHFAIYSHGGRISYRVFLSKTEARDFPFAERNLNQFWMEWNDYLIWEKLETLKIYLSAMRSIDPVRPIKVMTPHMFQSEALDLFEKYGAYPQLTGEGGWYRPMHYKGYSRLRGIPGSSEGGSAAKDARAIRQKFANMFWENQDAHDYVFDIQRDFWSRPDVVEWWKASWPLLRTFGKVDFASTPSLGVLRDVEQGERFLNGDIWTWDVSRGPLPSAGLSPVLIDGPDFDKGLADNIPVVFDNSTSVMTPERVEAIKKYVAEGGTFVAQFNTGRHSPLDANTWPLAKAFDLKVEDYRMSKENMHKWPTAKITFTEEQTLMPKLKGQSVEGSGVSIDYLGNEKTGAIRIEGKSPEVKPIAKWDDGSMAIAEVTYGKGRLIWIGSPFHVRFKDQEGKWMNEANRQALFEDLLAGLGVKLDTDSNDPRVWVERRESKNGLYDVFIAGALNMPDKKWKETDQITTNLTLRDAYGTVALDLTQAPPLEIKGEPIGDHELLLKDQVFTPYQIRQFAVVRQNPGLNGPLHWLKVQWNQWRALEPGNPELLKNVHELVQEQAKLLKQDGMDLNGDWKVRLFTTGKPSDDGWTAPTFDAASWQPGQLGTWLANGWKDTTAAQYRRSVTIPQEWLGANRRIFLGFKAGFHQMGIRGSGAVWLNGLPLGAKLQNPMVVDITKQAAAGKIDLAMQVEGDPMNGGPGGVLYLWSLPTPSKTIDLSGEWRKAISWHEEKGTVTLPGATDKAFGLRKKFELPADWQGKTVRLVVQQDEVDRSVDGVIVNQTGYFKEAPDSLDGYGIRIDQWLKDGTNEIDLYAPRHSSYQDYYKKGIPTMNGDIKGVRLELYE